VTETVDGRYYEVARPQSLAERLVVRARDHMYADFLRVCSPRPEDTILDVGVSDVITDAANMLERLYPHAARITAAGLGSATDFRASFPQISYRQIEPDRPLPFANRQFDIVTSNAVLEHVGSVDKQRRFLAELLRVGRRILVTVPHRYFPVEHHTAFPLVHWTDASFALACRLTGKTSWSRSENLILMSRRHLATVCPPGLAPQIRYTGIKLGPFSSNLLLYLENPA
jgi:SAM-dependent methyltransferase